MAISIPQKGRDNSGATTVPLNQATASGNLFVVLLQNFAAGVVATGVTDDATGGSSTYMEAAAARSTAGNGTNQVFFCLSTRSGATHITIAFSGTPSSLADWWYEVTGFTSTPSLADAGMASSASPTTTPAGPTLTVATAASFLAEILITASMTSINSPWVDDIVQAGNDAVHLIPISNGSFTPTWITTSSTYAASGAAFAVISQDIQMFDLTPGTCISYSDT